MSLCVCMCVCVVGGWGGQLKESRDPVTEAVGSWAGVSGTTGSKGWGLQAACLLGPGPALESGQGNFSAS